MLNRWWDFLIRVFCSCWDYLKLCFFFCFCFCSFSLLLVIQESSFLLHLWTFFCWTLGDEIIKIIGLIILKHNLFDKLWCEIDFYFSPLHCDHVEKASFLLSLQSCRFFLIMFYYSLNMKFPLGIYKIWSFLLAKYVAHPCNLRNWSKVFSTNQIIAVKGEIISFLLLSNFVALCCNYLIVVLHIPLTFFLFQRWWNHIFYCLSNCRWYFPFLFLFSFSIFWATTSYSLTL